MTAVPATAHRAEPVPTGAAAAGAQRGLAAAPEPAARGSAPQTRVERMLDALVTTERLSGAGEDPWGAALCRLVAAVEPRCRVERLVGALPVDRSGKGLDGRSVVLALGNLGYASRLLRVRPSRIDPRLVPALFIPRGGETPLLVVPAEGGGVRAVDPVEGGAVEMPRGRGWLLAVRRRDASGEPTSRFMRAVTGAGWFGALLRGFRGLATFGLLTGLVLNLLALAPPLLVMVVFDRVVVTDSTEALAMLAVGGLLAVLFEWWLRQLRSQGLAWLAGRLDRLVGDRIFSHLVGLSPELLDRASVTSQIARIRTFEQIRDFLSGSSLQSLLEAPFVVLSLLVIAALAGPLVFVPLVAIGVYLALFWMVRARVRSLIKLAARASSARQQFAIETFDKLTGVRTQGLSGLWLAKYRDLTGRDMMAASRLAWAAQAAETVGHAITTLTAVAVVGLGVSLVTGGAISAGALVATMLIVWRVLSPFYALVLAVPRLEQVANAVRQVNELMDLPTEVEASASSARLPRVKGAVSFQRVAFRYEGGTADVFTGLSFQVKPGEFVAVTGSAGSGRSTLLKLVKGLYAPTSGTVFIDGFDVRQLDRRSLRRQIALVPRRCDFFAGTVAQNLRLAAPLAREEELWAALERAAAADEVARLPFGLDTPIGRASPAVSDSLATRLVLARAYLHGGSILLIDDLANGVMSGAAGERLRRYLESVRGQRTVIQCTQREEFLSLADTVIAFRAGETPSVAPRDPSAGGAGPSVELAPAGGAA